MRLVATILLTSLLTIRLVAAQQQETPPGWSLYPSANIGAVYDDNLFFRARTADEGRSAVYTRFGLNLDAIHRGRTSSFRGGYGIQGEYFTGDLDHLTELLSDQSAYVNVSSSLGTRTSLDTAVSYNVSRNPNNVFQDVGLELGRRRAEGYSASMALTRQLSPTNSLGFNYGLGYRKLDRSDDFEAVADESVSHQAGVSWSQNQGPTKAGTLQYAYRLFDDRGRTSTIGLTEPFQSHVLTYGWSLQIGPRTTVSFYGGPNFFEDIDRVAFAETGESMKTWRITPQVSTSFNHTWERTNLSLSYGRSQSQFIGSTGNMITDSVGASVGYTPARRVTLSFSTGAARNTRGDDVFETYRAGVGARVEITRWWSLNGNYGYTNQDSGFFFGGGGLEAGRISRNNAYIGITLGKTIPLE